MRPRLGTDLSLFVPPACCGVWSFPHTSRLRGLELPLHDHGQLGYSEHAQLADYFIRRLHALAGVRPIGSGCFCDEPLSLLLAPYHLLRAGTERLSSLLALLRSQPYARKLTEVEHVPPLPLLLLEVLARGEARDTCHRDADMAALLEPEFGAMLATMSRSDLSDVHQRVHKARAAPRPHPCGAHDDPRLPPQRHARHHTAGALARLQADGPQAPRHVR